jgi:hypothetical protein
MPRIALASESRASAPGVVPDRGQLDDATGNLDRVVAWIPSLVRLVS